jgi:hypothetical protein
LSDLAGDEPGGGPARVGLHGEADARRMAKALPAR